MIERQKISPRQAVFFIFSTAFGTIIYLISAVIYISGREAWLAVSTGSFLVIPLAIWILLLGRMAPGKNIMEILEMVAGRIIGRTVAGFYVLISIAVTALVLRSIGGLFRIFVFPLTPEWFTIIMILLLATFIAGSGIEVQGRLGEVLQILLLIVFFAGLGLGYFTEANAAYIFPVFERGIGEFAGGTYLAVGSLAETLLFLMVMVAAFPRPQDFYPAIIKGYAWLALILGGAVLTFVIILSAPEAARITYGGFNAAVSLQIGKFVQGVEIFVQVALLLAVILKVTSHTYGSWMAANSITGNWHPRIFLAITALITAYMAIRVISFNEAYFLSIMLARYVTLPFVAFVLIITTAGVLIRGEKAVRKRT